MWSDGDRLKGVSKAESPCRSISSALPGHAKLRTLKSGSWWRYRGVEVVRYGQRADCCATSPHLVRDPHGRVTSCRTDESTVRSQPPVQNPGEFHGSAVIRNTSWGLRSAGCRVGSHRQNVAGTQVCGAVPVPGFVAQACLSRAVLLTRSREYKLRFRFARDDHSDAQRVCHNDVGADPSSRSAPTGLNETGVPPSH